MAIDEFIAYINMQAGVNITLQRNDTVNTDMVITGEVPIDISFESKNAPVLTGDAVNTYRTHPAFVFGSDRVAGIWVGKFEMTSDETTPKILPNSASIYGLDISNMFVTSLKIAGGTLSNGIVTFTGNNTYGLTANTDSRMMKNSEWGAVAYLSHSVYGINNEIRVNNTFITGCGALTPNAEYTNYYQITYGGTTSYPQSTTGNITRVFDMSGAYEEAMMGVLVDDNDNPRSGNAVSNNSGFNGLLANDSLYTSGIDSPQAKYYDKYTSLDPLTVCNGGICYGQALSETARWHSNLFIDSYALRIPWFYRPSILSGYNEMSIVGAFAGGYLTGII